MNTDNYNMDHTYNLTIWTMIWSIIINNILIWIDWRTLIVPIWICNTHSYITGMISDWMCNRMANRVVDSCCLYQCQQNSKPNADSFHCPSSHSLLTLLAWKHEPENIIAYLWVNLGVVGGWVLGGASACDCKHHVMLMTWHTGGDASSLPFWKVIDVHLATESPNHLLSTGL